MWLQVLDNGEVVQFDHPYLLLQDKEGLFYQMVQQTGQEHQAVLYQAAAQAYHKHTTSSLQVQDGDEDFDMDIIYTNGVVDLDEVSDVNQGIVNPSFTPDL